MKISRTKTVTISEQTVIRFREFFVENYRFSPYGRPTPCIEYSTLLFAINYYRDSQLFVTYQNELVRLMDCVIDSYSQEDYFSFYLFQNKDLFFNIDSPEVEVSTSGFV